jgi:hypothetical protein
MLEFIRECLRYNYRCADYRDATVYTVFSTDIHQDSKQILHIVPRRHDTSFGDVITANTAPNNLHVTFYEVISIGVH